MLSWRDFTVSVVGVVAGVADDVVVVIVGVYDYVADVSVWCVRSSC